MIKILFANQVFVIALLTAIFLTVFGVIVRYSTEGDNVSEPTQTVLISLTTTLYAYTLGLMINAVHSYSKFAKLAGTYDGYAYKDEESVGAKEFYEIEEKPQSEATIEYQGGVDFKITVQHPKELKKSKWVGDFKLTSSNMAQIAWWYVKGRPKYLIGHKRAVILDNIIVLFSDDRSVHRREVLIKQQD